MLGVIIALFGKDTEPCKTLPDRQIGVQGTNRPRDVEGKIVCSLDEYGPLVSGQKAIAQLKAPHLCHKLPCGRCQ